MIETKYTKVMKKTLDFIDLVTEVLLKSAGNEKIWAAAAELRREANLATYLTYQERLEAGVCVRCGSSLPEPAREIRGDGTLIKRPARCMRCRMKQAKRYEEKTREKLDLQPWKVPVTEYQSTSPVADYCEHEIPRHQCQKCGGKTPG